MPVGSRCGPAGHAANRRPRHSTPALGRCTSLGPWTPGSRCWKPSRLGGCWTPSSWGPSQSSGHPDQAPSRPSVCALDPQTSSNGEVLWVTGLAPGLRPQDHALPILCARDPEARCTQPMSKHGHPEPCPESSSWAETTPASRQSSSASSGELRGLAGHHSHVQVQGHFRSAASTDRAQTGTERVQTGAPGNRC